MEYDGGFDMLSLRLRWVLLILLAVSVLAFGQNVHAAKGSSGDKSKQAVTVDVGSLQEKDVDPFLASLTDAQTREVLQKTLKEQAGLREDTAAPEQQSYLVRVFVAFETKVRRFATEFGALSDAAHVEIANPQPIIDNLSGGQGLGQFTQSLFILAAITLCSLAVYWALTLFFNKFRPGHNTTLLAQRFGKLGTVFFETALQLIAFAVYFMVFALLLMITSPGDSPERGIGTIVFISLSYVLLVRIIASVLLSPASSALRPMPLGDGAALIMYRWLMGFTYFICVLAVISLTLEQIGGAVAVGRLLHASAGLCSSLVLAAAILVNRRRVAQTIDPECETELTVQSAVARLWHFTALAYALFIGTFWTMRACLENESLLRLVLSMFLIPVCIGIDLWVRKLMVIASGEDQQIIPLSPNAEPEAPSVQELAGNKPPETKSLRDYLPLISKILRVALVVFSIFAMLRIWGVEVPLGWLFARNVLSVLLVIVACLLIWEILRIRIDRKLSEDMFNSGIDLDNLEEGGGAGGSRSATLLVLLRKFLLTSIIVMGSLVTLSSMGVDIAPLIAGAGVFGLAIGFGAQTLVKDIISGVFFLIDDAFRVGDYVEAGAAKGTVEQISLRSMKLRHPRGMLFTIPYGGLKILKNFSRDYIITKLDFRVRYDADIEKIRKIIKRVNKEIMANEELSHGMLSEVKSMGVRAMEDSAMILRIKFKTIPGHQFVTQKMVYRLVQEAFRQNGIEFAHRNVTVYFPPEIQAMVAKDAASGSGGLTTAAASGAAAAASALIQEEEALALAAAAAAAAAKAESSDE
jgi:small-conductance mechanosensitive channel